MGSVPWLPFYGRRNGFRRLLYIYGSNRARPARWSNNWVRIKNVRITYGENLRESFPRPHSGGEGTHHCAIDNGLKFENIHVGRNTIVKITRDCVSIWTTIVIIRVRIIIRFHRIDPNLLLARETYKTDDVRQFWYTKFGPLGHVSLTHKVFRVT